MNNNNDWRHLAPKVPKRKISGVDIFVGVLLFVCVLILFGGLSIMLVNMAFNAAWPNIDTFRPGIGFTDAYRLFAAIWLFAIVRAIFLSGINRKEKN